MKKMQKGSVCICLVFFLILPIFQYINVSFAQDEKTGNAGQAVNEYNRVDSYSNYLSKYSDAPKPDSEIDIPANTYTGHENSEIKVLDLFEGEKNVLEWVNESGWVEWNADIPETGLYNIQLKYYPIKGKGCDIEIGMQVDGTTLFEGLDKNTFSRVWVDQEKIKRDAAGNDLRPKQVEAAGWIEGDFRDNEGLYNEAYLFYFEKGSHKIRLSCNRENIAIAQIKLYNKKNTQSYNEVKKLYEEKAYQPAQDIQLKIQGENSYRKSHAILYPMYDRSTPATEPSDPTKIRMNTIGSYNWKYAGQWISWKVEVPKSGLYQISFKARQNFSRGMFSTRKIYIDGKIPFSEVEYTRFPFASDWYIKTLGDDKPYQFYLEEGTHEIKLEVALGEMAQTLRVIDNAVYQLNYLYRKIIMITSAEPDTFRDYNLDKEIPDLLDRFKELREKLSKELAHIEQVTGSKGNEAASIQEVIYQLDGFIDRPDRIPSRLKRFKDNVSSLGAMILKIKEQPIELDYIIVSSADKKLPSAGAGIFEKLAFDAKAFIGSFIEKYNTIGDSADNREAVNVWVSAKELAAVGGGVQNQMSGGANSSGRDQAQVIKSMIDDLFTPKTGIKVNLNLVSSDTLVQAVLAGKGPDVSMLVLKETPINLAMRDALVDLSKFNGFEEIKKRYFPSAFIPYEYQGGCYALPETQNYYMMFYRKDILSELDLKPPKTWKEFFGILPIIQKYNMQVGIAENIGTFEGFVFQNNGNYFTKDRRATEFDKPEALDAFKQWTGLYRQYGLDRTFDFYNRFRTGEMPLALYSYPVYNLLSVAAPELRNLWGMAPIPGVEQPDGSINRAATAYGTGCVMLKAAKNKQAAFEFMKWWTSSDVQARYGTELESLMGPAARYDTANVEAFSRLPWSKAETEQLMSQWKYVTDVPQIPGNYYVNRNMLNAFRTVIDKNKNPREILNFYNREINEEILRKRQEFGLDK